MAAKTRLNSILVYLLVHLVRARPPWWIRPLVWMLVGGAALALWVVTSGEPRSFVYGNYLIRQNDGTWRVQPSGQKAGAVLEVRARWQYNEGLGWACWRADQVEYVSLAPGVDPTNMTAGELAQARGLAFQACADEIRAKANANTPPREDLDVELVGATMLRDDQTRVVHGKFYFVRRWAAWLGWALIAMGTGLRFVRISAREFARRMLANEAKELCPWCDYSVQGLPRGSRCPECGKDPKLLLQLARLIRGIPPKQPAPTVLQTERPEEARATGTL